MVIIVDDANRENEGDLAVAASAVNAEAVNFMSRAGRGLLCISISSDRAQKLDLPLQTADNNSLFGTPFTVSVDHREYAAQGAGAGARAYTMSRLAAADSRADEFVSPGHVFPLIAHPAGVLGRQGQTEGSHDLARIAGLEPAGVICEVLNADGSMARGAELEAFARKHALKITSVADILRYRINQEVLIRQVASSRMKNDYGVFEVFVFEDDVDGKEHLALVYGGVEKLAGQIPLVRIHSECLTGDVFGSRRCDCGLQLADAMKAIVAHGCGMVIYLRQEGRGIGLGNKLRAYELQDKGADTVEANIRLGFEVDQREYFVAARVLECFGVSRIKLLTNNPHKLQSLRDFGFEIVERIALATAPDDYSRAYLETKRDKMGHWL